MRKVGSASALTTSIGTEIAILRSAATDDDRGAITHRASTPWVTRLSTASCGDRASPSWSAIGVTEYPAARAESSTARRMLVGPCATALSTITPMRRVRWVARALAAMFGR